MREIDLKMVENMYATGDENLWVWNISAWDIKDILHNINTHKRCALTSSTLKNLANVFQKPSLYWTGAGADEYIRIKFPNRRKLYALDINADSTSLRLWGSIASSPSDTILSSYTFDFDDYTSLTGAAIVSDEIVGTGTWISDPIGLSASWIDAINYKYTGDGCNVYYRTSHDGLNWTDWSKDTYSITAESDLSTTAAGTYDITATSILTEEASTMGARTFRYVGGETVPIYGDTDFTGFYRYKVEYSPKHKSQPLYAILEWSETPQATTLATWDTTELDDGPYTVTITYEDDGGNQFSDSILMYVDNTDPVVTITSPAEGEIVGDTLEITYSVDDSYIQMYRIAVDGTTFDTDTDVFSGSASLDISSISNGLVTVQVIALDKAGNSTTVSVDVTKDNTAAIITEVSLDNEILRDTGNLTVGYTLNNNDTVTLTLYDDEDAEVGELDSSAQTAGTIEYEWDGEVDAERVEDGTYYIKIATTDTYIYTETFVLYDAAIEASITSPTDSDTVGFMIPIIGSAEDTYFDYYTLEYYSDSAWTIFLTGYSEVDADILGFLATNSLDTSIQIRLSVYDTAGNSTTDTVSLSVRNTQPTIGGSMKKAGTYSIDATSTLVNVYSIVGGSLLGGSVYNITGRSTLIGSYFIDAESELLDYSSVELGQLTTRDYIQIKIVTDNATVSNLAIMYSEDYYALTGEVSIDGEDRIYFNPTQLDYLYIQFMEDSPVVYELNELYLLECLQEEV